MSTAASAVSSIDYSAVGTSLALLVGAIAAVVAGLWKGFEAIKKSLGGPSLVGTHTDEKVRVMSAAIVETQTLQRLTESNAELRAAVCDLSRNVEDLINEMKSNRYAIQGTSEKLDRVASSLDNNSRVIDRTGLKI